MSDEAGTWSAPGGCLKSLKLAGSLKSKADDLGLSRERVLNAYKKAEARKSEVPLVDGALVVEPVDPGGIVMAAIDREGTWGLAVKSRPTIGHIPSIRLAKLSAEYKVRCQIHVGDEIQSVQVSLVRCQTEDNAVRELFATFAAAIVDELPPNPSEKLVAEIIERWVSLFWRLQQPSRADVIGLIGEIMVIEMVDDTAAWVAAWHSSSQDLIDFGFTDPGLEIEVKATSGRERVHAMTIHQADSGMKGERYFASVFVEVRDTGVSLGEVSQSIADRLVAGDVRRKFWTTIADTCGQQLDSFLATRFVRKTSADSLQFFSASDIPTPVIELPLPVGVSDLRFRSDFSSVVPVPLSRIRRI